MIRREKWTEFAVREARQTLLEWEQYNGTNAPPVPVENIADLLYALAIDTTDDLPDGLAGRLYVEDRIVAVRRSDIHVRQRFTIAHEIGHWRLHVVAESLHETKRENANSFIIDVHSSTVEDAFLPGMEDFKGDDQPQASDTRRQEIEANAFASELLMPAALIERTVEEHGADVTTLARVFDVSHQAMRFRLEKLLYLPPAGPQNSIFDLS